MFELLDLIKEPNDIKNIETVQYAELAKEIRRFLVQHISRTGGHLASNLGVVELTIAMHLCSTFPEDKIVWDVGHQCYTHKLLTGRKEEFAFQKEMKVIVTVLIQDIVQLRSVQRSVLQKQEISKVRSIRSMQ